jgi:SAM-dependent methyltransferase
MPRADVTPMLRARRLVRDVGRFVVFKSRLLAAMVRDVRDLRDPELAPLPPARLRQRVSGSTDVQTFLIVGRNVARDLDDLLGTLGRGVRSFENVLDFGCGPARVLRFLRDAPASCRLHGTDIDPESIAWCERNLPEIRWSVNRHHPPTHFADGAFDLIYSISVFTHLDEPLQLAWLQELRRIARPGAILIISVHGERLARAIPRLAEREIDDAGVVFVEGATGMLKPDGLPDFYQNSFHTRDYVLREWSKYFEVLEYRERAINDHQDAVLLRRR